MLILIILIAITVIILDYKYWNVKRDHVAAAISMFPLFLSVLVSIIMIALLSGGLVVDKKIAMYNEQNNMIQKEIAQVVESYKIFESETLLKIKSESPITLVTMFPDLRASQLVTKQLDVYINNNQMIKQLNNDKIDLVIYKWWLYFGR